MAESARIVPLPLRSLIGGLMIFGTALAQPASDGDGDGDAADPAKVIEEVIVTGSRILRREFTSPSPIATLDRAAILASGQPTLEEALKRMPQVAPDFGRTSNNPGSGEAWINLRGLGSNRTLVMLNGRRLAPAGVDNRVDVNTLPQTLIERVEIITGGASTVYGSDAVAGVVNFITREDFQGLELEASYYVTEQVDSEAYDYNLTWGHNFSSGRGNITLFGGYLDRKASFADDREISAVPLLDTWEGAIVPIGSPAIPEGHIPFPPADLGQGPVEIMFTPDGIPVEFVNPDNLYNFAPANYLQLPLERFYGGLLLNYDLTIRVETYFEALFSRNEIRRTLAPVPARGFFEINLDNPVLTPEGRQVFADNFIPTGTDTVAFFLLKRLQELGPRVFDHSNDYARFAAGLRGDFNATWGFDAWVTYTSSDEEVRLLNDASRSRLQQGLLVDPVSGQCLDRSNGCVPVNPFGAGALSPEALEFIHFAPFSNQASREQLLASAFIRGTPAESWAGPIGVVLGAEWRNDSGDFTADDALFTGDTLGFGGSSSVDGEERVSEIYAEGLVPLAADAPLAKYLAFEVGGRLSKYDHAGSTESYKFGGQWEPFAGFRFRGMYQRSIRAPDLVEAFQQEIRTVNDIGDQSNDPCSASEDPVGQGNAERCIQQGIPADQIGVFEAAPFFPTEFIRGGDPEVAPETGKTWTAGVVFSGFDHWRLSLDYFDLRIEDTIGGADPPAVCFDPANTSNVLCDRIRRDPVSLNVSEIDARTSNLGKLKTRGYDFQLNYTTELPSALAVGGASADLAVGMVWTHLRSLSSQENPVVEPVECAGKFGFVCPTTPENRVTTNAHYTSGKFDLLLSWRWIEGTDSTAEFLAPNFGFPDPIILIPSVGTKNYVDLTAGYRFSDRIEARLNVTNLFDTNPPLMADAVFSNNTDEGMYDIFGRSYQLTMVLRH